MLCSLQCFPISRLKSKFLLFTMFSTTERSTRLGRRNQVTLSRKKLYVGHLFSSLCGQEGFLDIVCSNRNRMTSDSNENYSRGLISCRYSYRIKLVLKSIVNGRNETRALNNYAIPVISYTAERIIWTRDSRIR